MASNFIPMLSSSPPPLDDNGSIDDDDEDFGDFATAAKVLDSPLDSPIKISPGEIRFQSEKEFENESFVKSGKVGNEVIQNGLEEHCETNSPKSLYNGELEVTLDKAIKHIPDLEYSFESSNPSLRTVSFSLDPVHNFSDEEDLGGDEEEEETLTHSIKLTAPKYDNISQESVSDSGLCSSSQWSDSSPLPLNEFAFSDVSPDEELVTRKNSSEETTDNDSYKHCNGNSAEEESSEHVRNYLESLPGVQAIEEQLEVSSLPCDTTLSDEDQTEVYSRSEDDDFADFESAVVRPLQEQVPQDTELSEDAFADFASASFGGETQQEQGDEEQWANFESSYQDDEEPGLSTAPGVKRKQEALNKPSLPNVCLERIISAFPKVDDDSSKPVDSISPNLFGALASSSHNVWALLEDLDQSLSLRYQWTGSETFQKTLHSLNIDSRNILRNPSVPVFALGLGLLLEPVKVVSNPTPEEILDKQQSPGAQEENIPPAQFDWNSSGLVNPLDPSQASSTLLDLDFFVTSIASSSSTSSKSISKTFSLEEELLQHSQSDSVSQQNVILEKLLSTMKSTHYTVQRQQCTRPADLSQTAVQILDSIPDLSYMRAKVLMFPLRSNQQDS